jgi:hypothetical protein
VIALAAFSLAAVFRSECEDNKSEVGSAAMTNLNVDQAAIDEQFGTGGIGRISGEVEGCCGDFGCGAGAAKRNAGLANAFSHQESTAAVGAKRASSNLLIDRME